jgi:hypothetical protein
LKQRRIIASSDAEQASPPSDCSPQIQRHASGAENSVAGGHMNKTIATTIPDHCKKLSLSGLPNGACVIHETH